MTTYKLLLVGFIGWLLMRNSKPLAVRARSRLKTVTKHKTKDFAEPDNQILLLTMLESSNISHDSVLSIF